MTPHNIVPTSHRPARRAMRLTSLALASVFAVVVVSSCTYSKEDGVALPQRFEEPDSLAFADDSLAEDQWVVANTEVGLNLRAAASVDSEALARIAAGNMVSSTGHVTDVEGVRWIEVRWNNQLGWVHSAYLAPPPSATPTIPPPTSEATGTDNETAVKGAIERAEEGGVVLVVTGVSTGLNLRDAPDGTVLGTLEALDEVIATGEWSTSWVEVVHDGDLGWVHNEFLLPLRNGDAVPGITANTAAMVSVTDSDGLNFRSAPDGAILAQLITGDIVSRTGNVSGSWVEVQFDNRTGWVASSYLVDVVGDLDDRGAAIDKDITVTNTPGTVGVNLRNSPNGQIIGGIPDGGFATLTGNKTDLWAEVEFENTTGWAFIELLLPVDRETEPQE